MLSRKQGLTWFLLRFNSIVAIQMIREGEDDRSGSRVYRNNNGNSCFKNLEPGLLCNLGFCLDLRQFGQNEETKHCLSCIITLNLGVARTPGFWVLSPCSCLPFDLDMSLFNSLHLSLFINVDTPQVFLGQTYRKRQ